MTEKNKEKALEMLKAETLGKGLPLFFGIEEMEQLNATAERLDREDRANGKTDEDFAREAEEERLAKEEQERKRKEDEQATIRTVESLNAKRVAEGKEPCFEARGPMILANPLGEQSEHQKNKQSTKPANGVKKTQKKQPASKKSKEAQTAPAKTRSGRVVHQPERLTL